MVFLFFVIFGMGFSLEAMQAAVKASVPVSQALQQAFWEVCSAVNSQNLEKAQALVTENPKLLLCVDAQKRTLLHLSIEKKWTAFSLWLVDLPTCPLNGLDDQLRSPLHRATFFQDTAVVAALVKKGVPFSASCKASGSAAAGRPLLQALWSKKNSPLHEAIEAKADDLADSIVRHKELLDSPNADGDTPLHFAVARLDEKAVELLLAAGACVAVANKAKLSPLHLAAAAESASLCALLLHRLGSLGESDVCRMLAKQPRVSDPHSQAALALLGYEKNYERHEEGLVTITNDTTWPLKITYVLAGKTGEIIIVPGDQFLLYAHLADLTKLEANVYGKQWHYAQWKPLDLYAPWREEVDREPRYTFEIKIQGEKSTVWQYITPFVISRHGNGNEHYQPASRVSKMSLIAEAFPCVMASLRKPKAVSARNFLQLSSSASADAVLLAFERLDTLWKRQRTLMQRPYVDRVRALLVGAREQLIAQKAGLPFPFDPQEIISPIDMNGPLSQPSLECLIALHKDMGCITPEVLTVFLKKFRKEEQLRLLRMQDSSGKTATFVALEKGNSQLFTFLLAKDAGESF